MWITRNGNSEAAKVGRLRARIVLGYRGPGKRFGVIRFANGRTFRFGAIALHVWRY